MEKYRIRYGDGAIIEMTKDEVADEVRKGVEDGVKRAKVPALSEDDITHITDVFCSKERIVSVEPGKEVVMTTDVGDDKCRCMVGASFSRPDEAVIAEKVIGLDSIDMGCQEYSYKNIKNIMELSETTEVKNALNNTIFPVIYGSMPNLGLYTQPDGMYPNWNDLLPQGKMKEARDSQEKALVDCTNDIYRTSKRMYEMGIDAVNFDTTAASGDADFMAGLQATERLKKEFPDLPIEMGMASEFVLGNHCGLKYGGKRLAGMFPHQQVEVCQEAEVDIFGPVVNTNTSRTTPWNVGRVCTMIKECSRVSQIPLHANAGMGVNGIPMSVEQGADAVSRVAKCLVEICKIDGL